MTASPEALEMAAVAARAADDKLATDIVVIDVSDQLVITDCFVLASEVGLNVHTDPRLRETNLGTWQGMSHSEVDEQWPDARLRWRSSPRWSPPDGESRIDVARRTREVVDELVESSPEWGEHPAVIVAHGGAIAALTGALLELPVEHYPMFNGLGNTCWVQLSAHPRPANPDESHAEPEVAPTTDAARALLWRLDQWNAGITPPVDAP